MSLIDADTTLAGNQAFTVIGDAAFDTPGALRLVLQGSITLVEGNTDADTDAEFAFRVVGTAPLDGSDFIL